MSDTGDFADQEHDGGDSGACPDADVSKCCQHHDVYVYGAHFGNWYLYGVSGGLSAAALQVWLAALHCFTHLCAWDLSKLYQLCHHLNADGNDCRFNSWEKVS